MGPYALLQKHTSEITSDDIELATSILNRYCGPLEELSMDKFDNFTKMGDDSFFLYGIYKLLDLHMKQSTGSTFYYRMKYYVRKLIYLEFNRVYLTQCQRRIHIRVTNSI